MSGLMWIIYVLLPVLHGARHATTCAGPRVQISARAGDTKNYNTIRYGNYIDPPYGDTVRIFCSASTHANLYIMMDSVIQPTEVVNETTLLLTLKKPDIARYIYRCIDMVTTCVASLTVEVTPILAVLSPNVRQIHMPRHGGFYFFVPITEDYEVLCSGNRSDLLYVIRENMLSLDVVETYVVNETTIKSSKLHEIGNRIYRYECVHNDMSDDWSDDNDISQPTDIYVDYPPAAMNFWCIEYINVVNCTWNVTSLYTNFTLIYVDDEVSMSLCEDLSFGETTRLCKWSIMDLLYRGILVNAEFNFVMRACNFFFCADQIFHIEHHTVAKALPPKLALLNSSSNNAIIAWHSIEFLRNFEDGEVEYKVTYWMPGTQPKELDLSTLRGVCTRNNGECEKELKLPCPGTLYEVKVYARLTTTPQKDVYWSDPASITFRTDSQDMAAVNPMCSKEEELITNKERGVFAVQLLKRNFRKDMKPIHKKIDALKQKLAFLKKGRPAEP